MKEAQQGTVEALRQFIEGNDFEPPGRMIGDLTPEYATMVPDGCPYSIAGVVAHMLFWQQLWLDRIDGQIPKRSEERNFDWPPVTADDWDQVRSDFLCGLEKAQTLAADPIERNRQIQDGETVDDLLLMMVLHNSYHLGQIALLRQLLKLWPPAEGRDVW